MHRAPSGVAAAGSADPRVGGTYRVVMEAPDGGRHVAFGTYREIQRPGRLVFTWQWEGGMNGFEGETTVTVEMRPADAGTEVVLTHEGFPTAEQRQGHEDGWTSCLENLERRGLPG